MQQLDMELCAETKADRWFRDWLATETGAEVADEFFKIALGLLCKGWRQFGAKAIVEHIRWERMIEAGPDQDGYKVNNNCVSRLARLAEQRAPELEGFFKKRELKS